VVVRRIVDKVLCQFNTSGFRDIRCAICSVRELLDQLNRHLSCALAFRQARCSNGTVAIASLHIAGIIFRRFPL
jgi:hypothetical protein